MTEVNPCGFLQNAGATHTAEQMRNWHGLLVAGKGGATSLLPRGGVNPALGNALQVTQTGSPSMAVIVKSGHATIPGSEGSKQGVYSVMNDGDVTLSIAASHATLHRIDLVCFKVEDSAYSGGANTSSLVVVAGTPASSPAAPSAPANSIILAQVSIVANDTSITTGEITDRRQYMSALGGLIPVAGSTERDALTAYEGQGVYRADNDTIEAYSGSAWKTWYPYSRTGTTLRRVANQSLNTGVETPIQYDTEDVDTSAMWAIGTPTTITIPEAGLWAITFRGVITSIVGTGYGYINITSSLFSAAWYAPDVFGRIGLTVVVPLAASDTFQTALSHASGGARNATAYLAAYKLGG